MEGWLKIMTLDFQPVDSMAYGKQTYYMTIENDILYSVQVGNLLNPYDPDQITRFDLRRKTFLPNIPSPARSLGGIRFYNGKFYYGDYLKGIVGVLSQYDLDVPLPDR
jgi:hypothetical protein